MSPTEYDTDILKKHHNFLASCIPASQFASLEDNGCFFRTQLSHLWNTTSTSLEQDRHIFGTQHAGCVEMNCDCSNYNTVTVLI